MFRLNGLFITLFFCTSLQAASFQWLVDEIKIEFKDRIAECNLKVLGREDFQLAPQRETTGVIVNQSGEWSREVAYVSEFIGIANTFRIQNGALQNRYDVDLSQFQIRFVTPYLGSVARAISLTRGKTRKGFTTDYTKYYCRSGQVSYLEFRVCLEEMYLEPLIAELCHA